MTPDTDDLLGLPEALPATGVRVQLLRIGVLGAVLRWTSTCRALPGGQSPDDVARTLADLSEVAGDRGATLHSTSWRYEHARVVLTYAVFPDPGVQPSWTRLGEHVAISAGPVDPSPQDLCDADVAAHAARHLADLAGGRDPHFVSSARRQPQAWHRLLEHARRVHAHPLPALTAAAVLHGPAATA